MGVGFRAKKESRQPIRILKDQRLIGVRGRERERERWSVRKREVHSIDGTSSIVFSNQPRPNG